MAVVLLTNACIAGAYAGLMSGRTVNPSASVRVIGDYASYAAIAAALGTAWATANAALLAPLADGAAGDKTTLAVYAAAHSTMVGRMIGDATPAATDADMIAAAQQIAASAGEIVTKLT